MSSQSFVSKIGLKFGNFLIRHAGTVDGGENRIYVLSFPKCGRTWMRSLLNHYFYILYPLSVTREINSYMDRIPIIRYIHLGKTLQSSEISSRIKFMKNQKVILIFRDPRDVFVSYFFHITKAGHHPLGTEINWNDVDIGKVLRHEVYGIRQIVNYMNTVYEDLHLGGRTYITCYEKFKLDTKSELANILKFLGDGVISQRAMDKSIEYNSFDKMQSREVEGIANEFQISTRVRKTSGEESLKMRKGKVGGYIKNLNGDDLEYANKIFESLNPDLRNLIRYNN